MKNLPALACALTLLLALAPTAEAQSRRRGGGTPQPDRPAQTRPEAPADEWPAFAETPTARRNAIRTLLRSAAYLQPYRARYLTCDGVEFLVASTRLTDIGCDPDTGDCNLSVTIPTSLADIGAARIAFTGNFLAGRPGPVPGLRMTGWSRHGDNVTFRIACTGPVQPGRFMYVCARLEPSISPADWPAVIEPCEHRKRLGTSLAWVGSILTRSPFHARYRLRDGRVALVGAVDPGAMPGDVIDGRRVFQLELPASLEEVGAVRLRFLSVCSPGDPAAFRLEDWRQERDTLHLRVSVPPANLPAWRLYFRATVHPAQAED